MSINETLARHERVILQFSGGKDSLACLYQLRDWWNKVLVVWVNPGDEMPETWEVIRWVQQLPVRFVEVRPILPLNLSIELHGIPTDIIPLRNTNQYSFVAQREMTGATVQNVMECCNRQLFKPLHEAVQAYGATLVIRGQRLSEDMHSPLRSGDVIDGVEYLFPLESWSEQDVFNYLDAKDIPIPTYYKHIAHSPDCATCTAFLDQSQDKIAYLKKFWPVKYQVVKNRLAALNDSLEAERRHLIDTLNI